MEANLTLEGIKKELLAEREIVCALQEKAERHGQRITELEGSLEMHDAELTELKGKHLELVEDHYQVSSDFVGFRRQLEDGFVSVAAASTDITMRVKQLDLVTDPPVLAPNCQSLPLVAEFISRVAADVRTFKNKTARRLRNDRNGASQLTAARVMALFREANPNAVTPNFWDSIPSDASLQVVDDSATALAAKMFQHA